MTKTSDGYRGAHELTPPGGGRASVDAVLEYAGVVHPSVTTHLLATLGVLLVSISALAIGPLLPVPLHGCWGAVPLLSSPRSVSCQGYSLFPHPPLHPIQHVIACEYGSTWFQLSSSPLAVLLVVVRVFFSIISGVCLDVHGRRRVAVIGMGTYFMFSFSRSFAPEVDVTIVAVVVEAVAAQASVMALLLICVENSTQRECVRSACLVLLGHSLGVGALAATVDSLLHRQLWTQLAKSLPSAGFVILLCWLPESLRWTLDRGDWVDAIFLFPKTHGVRLDEVMKPKLMAARVETQRSLRTAGCQGSALRKSVCPVVKTGPLLRVGLLCSLCGLVYGMTVGTRLIVDPSPYTSLGDRSLAFGASELTVLIAMGLVLGRAGARLLLCVTFSSFAIATALTVVPASIHAQSCLADVAVSLLGHSTAVAAGVALIMAVWRLTPTHSRGIMSGLVWAWVSLGFAVAGPYCDLMDSLHPPILQHSLKTFTIAGACLLTGLLALLLPVTPSVLPDALTHLRRAHYEDDEPVSAGSSVCGSQVENTRL